MEIIAVVLAFGSFSALHAQVDSKKMEAKMLTEAEFAEVVDYLGSKNLEITDHIFIKYDFNKAKCWNILDGEGKKKIQTIVNNFHKHIADFNAQFSDAVAYNFREPGSKFNKVKLWDDTIIVDDLGILRKNIFKEKIMCGTSALIVKDRSYILYPEDPHFELLEVHQNYSGKKF